ncbi:MAG: hypothetical protein AAFQ80_15995 [Cyanobacteria bacterium J06621_8]
MTINVYCDADPDNSYDYIITLGESEDLWDLPSQIYKLEQWLETNIGKLNKGSYVADIGFTVREDATGGGAVLNRKMILMLHQIGMEIYFSEYNFIDEV